ncbi:hypothetical protein GQ600_16843 [Phytophthora cactorum]|nr:hypothetical protein GQ600_16843 [Phytophthora cactorum]
MVMSMGSSRLQHPRIGSSCTVVVCGEPLTPPQLVAWRLSIDVPNDGAEGKECTTSSGSSYG